MISILGLGCPGIPGPHQVSWPGSPRIPCPRAFLVTVSLSSSHRPLNQAATRAQPELENPMKQDATNFESILH